MPESEVCSSITAWFPRLHSLVIGPGLGRDPKTLSAVKLLISVAKEQEKDIVIDAVNSSFKEFTFLNLLRHTITGWSILSNK